MNNYSIQDIIDAIQHLDVDSGYRDKAMRFVCALPARYVATIAPEKDISVCEDGDVLIQLNRYGSKYFLYIYINNESIWWFSEKDGCNGPTYYWRGTPFARLIRLARAWLYDFFDDISVDERAKQRLRDEERELSDS